MALMKSGQAGCSVTGGSRQASDKPFSRSRLGRGRVRLTLLLTLPPRAPCGARPLPSFADTAMEHRRPPMGWILSSVSLSQRRFAAHCRALSARRRHILIPDTLCGDKVFRCYRTVAEIENPVT
jgi:hypothetical protein